ncbi:hypothetical protein R3P38DRAFT_2810654 [Favolaschia claudopus]|uniref:Uncharacterized protein n=1 Tax=Favolaschia claudopus TaxID=2862362 RepID=A0AAV9ZAA1_9AGAR
MQYQAASLESPEAMRKRSLIVTRARESPQAKSECKKITVPQIDLQLKWHRLREVETDKKTEIPSTSKLKKAEKAEVLVAAIRRWMPRVEAGEVQLMGKGNTEAPEEQNETIESDDEEDEVGYGDQN